jgi:hypothetical protein
MFVAAGWSLLASASRELNSRECGAAAAKSIEAEQLHTRDSNCWFVARLRTQPLTAALRLTGDPEEKS